MGGNVAEALRLMLVTDDRLIAPDRLLSACQAAVRGGVTSVQLRLKEAAPRDLLALARQLIRELPVPVLLNDHVDVALAAGAAGAHLGPDDLPLRLARRIVPEGFLLGASVGSEAEREGADAADYWGVGPLRATATKRDAGPALGIEGFARFVELAGTIPCVAIGGVTPPDVAAVARAGGAGVAVISGVLAQADLEAAARSYRAAANVR